MGKTKLPSMPLTGGCQCGRLRYRVSAAPLAFYLCHCSECQRQTSSAFGESLRLARQGLEVSGEASLFERTAESGARREGWFCPSCGVRIWHGTKGSPEINLKAGTLDDTSWLIPSAHIWARSRQPFVSIDDGALVYEGQPGDGYQAIKARWATMTEN